MHTKVFLPTFGSEKTKNLIQVTLANKVKVRFIPGAFPSYTERILPPEKINEKRSQEKQQQQKTLPHTWIHIKNGDYGKNVSTSLY